MLIWLSNWMTSAGKGTEKGDYLEKNYIKCYYDWVIGFCGDRRFLYL